MDDHLEATTPTLFTIGHSSRALEELIAMLQAHDIDRLVDVRRYPGSRRFPHFAKDALAESLATLGIAYSHEVDLGGRRKPLPDSPNTFWQDAGFRGYADHLASDIFESAMDRVLSHAARERVALMCAEAVPWRCHRQLIADWLVARDIEVRHILSTDRAEPHQLNPAAHSRPNGELTYPGLL